MFCSHRGEIAGHRSNREVHHPGVCRTVGTGQTRRQRNELIELVHLDDRSTQIEFWLRGTPTTSDKPFEVCLWAIYTFDADDLMTNERVYAQPPTEDQVAGRVTTDGKPTV